jgi:hypothetical protein
MMPNCVKTSISPHGLPPSCRFFCSALIFGPDMHHQPTVPRADGTDRTRCRLEATLTEMKRKHEMPVKGWRPVAAVHNAKNEMFRQSYKERMEQVDSIWQSAAYTLLTHRLTDNE